MIDRALIEHAKQGALRPIEPGDEVFVVGLGPALVRGVSDDLYLVEIAAPDGSGFVAFTDHIAILRRAS
jgi:hypothetical protein